MEEITTALKELPVVLGQMGVACLGMPNVEADDLIATLATHYSRTSLVTIFSADKVCITLQSYIPATAVLYSILVFHCIALIHNTVDW